MSKRTLAEREVPADEHGQLLFDVFASDCPSRQAMENVTGRWGILAMVALHHGEARFGVLRRKVSGVSEKMLAQTLQALERDGFVHREAEPSIPPKVEYSLTPLGEEIANKLYALIEQLEGRMPAIMLARERYDQAKAVK